MAQRWGLTLPLPATPLGASEEHVKRAEAAGYTDLWSGETNGPDGFTPLALAAAWTEKARLGTGIVGVMTRGPALLAQQTAAMADASGGRFALGIGASSDRIVSWNKLEFSRPLGRVEETIDFLRPALAGERTETGFKLEVAPQGFELLCRFFCLPGEREQVEPLARFMFASYVSVPVYAAFFRWLG